MEYRDDLIHMTHEPQFTLLVFVNAEGKSETVDYTNNMFEPNDVLLAYKRMIPSYIGGKWAKKMVDRFAAYLKEEGGWLECWEN